MKAGETTHWIHNLDPFLVRFPESVREWGPDGIRWYGLAYLAGFVVAGLLLGLYRRKGRSPYDRDQLLNLLTFQVLGVLLGGRIGYVLLYKWSAVAENPLMVLRVWEGGMASHGGFVGVCIATLWYVRLSRQSPFPVGDLVVSIVPPGLFFGRLANFINGELWGKSTEVSWGVKFPASSCACWVIPSGVETYSPDWYHYVNTYAFARHPSQLYAAALEGLLTFAFVQWRFWKTDVTTRVPGRLAGEFLILYAIARIAGEFFREPDATLIADMSRGQFYSLFLAVGGIVLILLAERGTKRGPEA